jgi:hypothetical protein
MILIAHRGNTEGPREDRENMPDYLDEALGRDFDIEVDLWVRDGDLYLGHDGPEYKVGIEWVARRKDKLWVHCKDIQAMVIVDKLRREGVDLNYFWHEKDTMTLTSNGFIWVYPGKQPVMNSIAVLPEMGDEDVSVCIGVCSDWVSKYKSI